MSSFCFLIFCQFNRPATKSVFFFFILTLFPVFIFLDLVAWYCFNFVAKLKLAFGFIFELTLSFQTENVQYKFYFESFIHYWGYSQILTWKNLLYCIEKLLYCQVCECPYFLFYNFEDDGRGGNIRRANEYKTLAIVKLARFLYRCHFLTYTSHA